MSDSTNFLWDGNSNITDNDPDEELGYNDLWEPWKNNYKHKDCHDKYNTPTTTGKTKTNTN